MPEETRQSIIDEEHLKVLSIAYLVSAGITAFLSLFGMFYIFMGLMMNTVLSDLPQNAAKASQGPPPAFVGWIFICLGLVFFLGGTGLAAAKFRAAWCIKHRKWRVFCMVIAGIGCLEFPYGTALGIFTFLILGRDSVVRLFTSNDSANALVQS